MNDWRKLPESFVEDDSAKILWASASRWADKW